MAFLAVIAALVVGTGGYWITRRIQEFNKVPPVPSETTLPAEAPAAVVEETATPNPFANEPKPWDPKTPVAVEPVAETPDTMTTEQLEALKKKVKVTMFMTAKCSLCTSARLFMKNNGYPMSELDIEASPTDKVLLSSLNPETSVPTFDVEGNVLVGYDPNALNKAIEAAALAKKARKR